MPASFDTSPLAAEISPTPTPDLAATGHTCQNCGVSGGGKFCQNCGQSHATHRITVGHLLHEVVHLFTHLDKGILFTLKELATNAGTMQRRYLAGQRVRYQPPFSTFFVAVTVLALGQFFIKTQLLKHYGLADSSTEYFRHYFSLLQMALIPAYAFITWLFFRKSGYGYAEIIVVVLYNLAFVLLLILLINATRLLWPHLSTRWVELPVLVLYNTWTYFQLFPTTSRWVLLVKSLFINSTCFALAAAVELLAVRALGER